MLGAPPRSTTGVVDHIVRVGKAELRARCGPNISIPAETTVTVRIDPADLTLIPLG